MVKATDDEILETVASRQPNATAKRVGEDLNMTRQGAHQRLQKLEQQGRVERVDFGRDVGWYVDEEQLDSAESGELSANSRNADGFEVSVRNENDDSLLIQPAENGYKLDIWWENEDGDRRQSSVHAEYGIESSLYTGFDYDNCHERRPVIRAGAEEGIIVIRDPEPRAPLMGYEPAELRVSMGDDGFVVEVTWTDIYGEEHTSVSTAPLYDPRFNDEDYYRVLEENYKRTKEVSAPE